MTAHPMHHVVRGDGRPLVLVHGLGSSWANWLPVMDQLSRKRRVIAVDLPGFGETPPLDGDVSIATLTDAIAEFLTDQDLEDADVVGSSMGARMVLELARRGHRGSVVALSPGGFWTPAQRTVFAASIRASIALIRLIQPLAPSLSDSAVGRTALLSQFSDHPWALDRDVVLTELRSFARATSLDDAFRALAYGPTQAGSARTPARVSIGWGRQDRVTFPAQANLALARFPQARFRGFERCGHFPHWDQPDEAARFILSATSCAADGRK